MCCRRLLPVILFLLSFYAQAREFVEYGSSIRALGMGNAYVAVVNDADSLWYNPGALGRVKGINLTILNLNVGLNGQTAYDNYQEYNSSVATGVDRFSSFFGDQIWLGVGGKVALTTPYFGFGLYDAGHAGIELRNPALPRFDIDYVNDYGIVTGGAIGVGPSSYLGMSLKRINRVGSIGSYAFSSFADGSTSGISSDVSRSGVAYGVDLGFAWEIPGPLNPVLAASWMDVGTTTFLVETGQPKPPKINDNRTVGVSAGFDLKVIDMTAALDIRHINEPSEPIGKKMHLGLEMGLPFVDVRAGISQGYTTYGATVDLLIMRLDVASYGVELGEYPGQDEDRRIQAQLVMEFGFDPSFNLIDFGPGVGKGKGRKLKLRR